MDSSDEGQMLAAALGYAARGWPVFPCHEGAKTPVTRHGCLDATTDPRRITAWWTSQPEWNVAIATGAPGPDVLDVDHHGPHANGFAAFRRLRAAGLLGGAGLYVRTPSGGMHIYFAGTAQRNARLRGQHLDYRGAGGYVVAPPSAADGRPYQVIKDEGGTGRFGWADAAGFLEPARLAPPAPRPGQVPGDIAPLARWVAGLKPGNRNDGLFWAACRALEADPAAELGELAAAAETAGLGEPEISRTLGSARRRVRAA